MLHAGQSNERKSSNPFGMRMWTCQAWKMTYDVFNLISKYGFNDVLRDGHAILDPSRVASRVDLRAATSCEVLQPPRSYG